MMNNTRIEFVDLSDGRLLGTKMFYKSEVRGVSTDLREALIPFIPENALDEVVAMLRKYNFVLRIETPRKKTLGYFSWPYTIGINNNLDKETFLRVFIHEYAHRITYLCFRYASMHGNEFYYCYRELVLNFIYKNIIPESDFLPIVNKTGAYEFFRKNNHFRFHLKRISVGFQFLYNDETYTRGKGSKGMIDCIRIADNTRVHLSAESEVLPVMDFEW